MLSFLSSETDSLEEPRSVVFSFFLPFLLSFKSVCLYFFLCMDAFPIWMSVCLMHAEPAEARRGCWEPWNWSHGQLRAAMWVLGPKLGCQELSHCFSPFIVLWWSLQCKMASDSRVRENLHNRLWLWWKFLTAESNRNPHRHGSKGLP